VTYRQLNDNLLIELTTANTEPMEVTVKAVFYNNDEIVSCDVQYCQILTDKGPSYVLFTAPVEYDENDETVLLEYNKVELLWDADLLFDGFTYADHTEEVDFLSIGIDGYPLVNNQSFVRAINNSDKKLYVFACKLFYAEGSVVDLSEGVITVDGGKTEYISLYALNNPDNWSVCSDNNVSCYAYEIILDEE